MAETIKYPTRDGKKYEGSNPDVMPCAIFETSKSFKGTLPANKLTWTGAHFAFWNTKADGTGTRYNNGQEATFTSPTILYAIWQWNNYTVKFDANGGSGTMSNVSMVYSKNYTLPTCTFTNGTKLFRGWSTSKTATSPTYTNGASVKNLSSTNNGTVTLYAVWEIVYKTLTLKANFSGVADNITTIAQGSSVAIYNPFTRSGYKFFKFNTNSSGTGTNYEVGKTFTLNSDLTLYAIWDGPYYSITYSASGASNVPAAQEKKYNVAITLSSTKPTKANYNFVNWLDRANNRSFNAGGSYTYNNSATLEAQFTPVTYAVTFNANGGSGSMSSTTKTYGVNLSLPACSFSAPNNTKRFKCWATASNGTGSTYADKGTYTANAAVTLYAIWETKPTCIITFKSGFSGLADITQTVYSGVATALRGCSWAHADYSYDGWATSSGGAKAYNEAQIVAITSNLTLYARWIPRTITSVNYTKTALNSKLTPTGGAYGWHRNWNIYAALTSYKYNTVTSTGWPTTAGSGWGDVVDNTGQITSGTIQATKESASGSSKVNVTGGCGGVILDYITMKVTNVLITRIIIAPYIYTYSNNTNKWWCWCDRGVTAGAFAMGQKIGTGKQCSTPNVGASYCDSLCGGGSCVKAYGRGASMSLTMTIDNNGSETTISQTVLASIAVNGWTKATTALQNLRVTFDFGSQLIGFNKKAYTKRIYFRAGSNLMPVHGIDFYIN